MKLMEPSQEKGITSQPLLDQNVADEDSNRAPGHIENNNPSRTTNLAGNRVGTEVTIPMHVRDPDGDTIIDVEATEAKNQRRRQETYDMTVMNRQLLEAHQDNMHDAPDLSTLLRRFETILQTRTHDAVQALDTRQKVWEQSILHQQSRVHTQERLLQERIKLHEQRVLRAETTLSEWETMLTAQEERLTEKEAEMTARLRKTEADLTQRTREMDEIMEERQSERILEDGSEWEDHINTKTKEYVTFLIAQLKEKESSQLALYTASLDQLATQRELKTKAWMEVVTTQTLDGLSDKLTRPRRISVPRTRDTTCRHLWRRSSQPSCKTCPTTIASDPSGNRRPRTIRGGTGSTSITRPSGSANK
jgi:hypothetical protein